MSNKILNKVNNDIFSYETTGTGGVFKMSRIMPTEIHHTEAGVGTNGYLLASTGNGWTWTDPSTISTGSVIATLPELTDVTITSLNSNQILSYNGTNWVNTDLPASSSTLPELTDVTISSLTNNQILSYNGSNWVNTDLPASISTLSDLTDVTISSLTNNQILSYNGTNWVNIDQVILKVGTSIKSTLSGNNVNNSNSISLGVNTGNTGQNSETVAIGFSAGSENQAQGAVAIGYQAGYDNQGAYSVAIGNNAGKTNQAANSIVLNAQSAIALDAPNTGFFVKPINSSSNSNKLLYNETTGEITYQPDLISDTLNTDTITEKTTDAGITLTSVVKMSGIQSATNSNKLLYNETTGEITYQPDLISDTLNTDTITEKTTDAGITLTSVVKMTGIQSDYAGTAHKLCYNPDTGEVTHKEDTGGFGGQTISKGMVVQYAHNDYKKQVADTGGTDWRPPDADLSTGFVVHIKPVSAFSKIVVKCNAHVGIKNSQDDRWWGARLYKKVGTTGDWTHVSEADNSHIGDIANGQGVWFTDNMGISYQDANQDDLITQCAGEYMDTAGSTDDIYYTIFWKARLGDSPGTGDLFLNRQAKADYEQWELLYRPQPISSWSAIEIWDEGATFGGGNLVTDDLIVNTLSTDDISEKTTGSGITLNSVVKMTGIQSDYNETAHKLCYNPATGEVTHKEDTGGGQTISKGMVVQYVHNDYKKQIADTDGTGWRAPDNDINTGFVVHIRPISASSKILVKCNAHVGIKLLDNDARWWGARLYKKVGTGNWTHVSDADNSLTGDTANGQAVWFTDNMGTVETAANLAGVDQMIAQCAGEYMDTAGSTDDIYYTIYWKSRLGDYPGTSDLFLNRQAGAGDAFRPLPISNWDAIEIWDEGATFGGGNLVTDDLIVNTLSTDAISEKTTGSGITLNSVVKMTGIQSDYNETAYKLCYNPTTGEVTHKEDTSGGGGQTISKGMVVQYVHNDYKKQIADTDGSGWRAPDENLETGFVVHIKPVSASSKIVVKCNAHVGVKNSQDDRWWGARLYKKVGTGAWTHVSDADNTLAGDTATGQGVWFTDNMGMAYQDAQFDYFITQCAGEYMDTAGSTDDIYYTIFWKAQLGDAGTGDLFLNRQAETSGSANDLLFRPQPISSWSAIEIWDEGATFGGGNLVTDDLIVNTLSTDAISEKTIGSGITLNSVVKMTGIQSDYNETAYKLCYNPTTGEVTYKEDTGGGGQTISKGMVVQYKHTDYKKQVDDGQGSGWRPPDPDLETGFVVHIKPVSASSKILVRCNAHVGINQVPLDSRWWGARLYKKVGTGDWTHISEADNTKTGDVVNNNYGTPVWFSDNMGALLGENQINELITNCSGEYLDTAGSTEDIYYTIFWKARLSQEGHEDLYLNRHALWGDNYRPLPISSWDAIEIWDEGDVFGGTSSSGGGVPAPTKVVSESTGLILPEGNILNNEFTKATISGTNVEIDGTVIGTTVGTGVDLTLENGISTTTSSYVALNPITWSPEFSIELYFKSTHPPGDMNAIFFSNKSTDKTHGQIAIDRERHFPGGRFSIIADDGAKHGLYEQDSMAGFDGTFGHLICTYSVDGGMKMYSNGALVTPTGNWGNAPYYQNFAHGVEWPYNFIGARPYDNEENVGTDNGLESVKTLRIYSRALSEAEIQTLYENKDLTTSSPLVTDVTNYALVSNNADGTETKWLNVVPAPVVSESSGFTLPEGNTASFDFTKATLSGTNDVVIDETVIGTTAGNNAQNVGFSSENGISTDPNSHVELTMNGFEWTSNFTIEFYFKMPSITEDSTQQENPLFSSFNGVIDGATDIVTVGRRVGNTNGIHWYTGNATSNTYYCETDVAGFDGTWGHLVLTHDSSLGANEQKKMYENGVLFTNGVLYDGPQINFPAGTRDNYLIGACQISQFERGVENLKILRIYNRVLTPAEALTLYENRDNPIASSDGVIADLTNYVLASNNADGTETKWLNVVPAPVVSSAPISAMPDGKLLDLDFRKATITGTNVEIDGTVVGNTVNSGVLASPENGISSTYDSYVSLDTQLISWTVNFTVEVYFKLVGGSYATIFGAWNNSEPNSHVWLSRRSTYGPNFRTGPSSGGNGGNNLYDHTTSNYPGWDGDFGHIILTHNSSLGLGEQKKLYINGQLRTDATLLEGGNDEPFVTGYKDNFWLGRIDDSIFGDPLRDNGLEGIKVLRVFDHVLTPDEITTLYENKDVLSGEGVYASGGSSDVTNYHLVSSNSTGTATQWVPMSRPYANIVNFATADYSGITLIQGLTDLPFDEAVLSYGINLVTAGGVFFTVENSGVYVCNVSFRGGGPDSWQTMYLRDSNNNIIATSHAIGTTNSIEAGFFVMAQLNPGTSYKFTIHRLTSSTVLFSGHPNGPIGYQINCIIHSI